VLSVWVIVMSSNGGGNSVLINGIGTVGSRTAHLLLSMGIPVHGVKSSALKDDLKTQELLSLYNRFGAFPIAVVPGENYEQRVQQFKELGFKVLNNPDLSRYSVVVDATDGAVTAQNVARYTQSQRFLVQGGTDYELVKKDFVSVPNGVAREFAAFPRARQVSCNTTFCSTALGLVLEHVGASIIASVDVELHRRCRDPGEKKEFREALALKDSHHADDVMNVVPQVAAKVTSKANINAWEHFHHTQLLVSFAQPIDVRAITEEFKNYPRCIFVEPELTQDPRVGMKTLRAVSDVIRVPDGDCLLPVYSLQQLSPTSILIRGFTPQRSVIALSCVDWVLGALGRFTTWEDAFAYTNKNARWHGHTIAGLKQAYEEKVRVKVAV